jgi:AcrR family transcriptional regulator
MGRWEPNARERLEEAALTLYREKGFDETTVEEIAARAGLTERTFFRHFADKREVLFGGSKDLEGALIGALSRVPSETGPVDAVEAALETIGAALEQLRGRDFARKRHAIIKGHAELYERELIKLATLAAALADGLKQRGIAEPLATLTAEAGIGVFKVAFRRWLEDPKERNLAQYIRESMNQLKGAVTSPGARGRKGRTKRTL